VWQLERAIEVRFLHLDTRVVDNGGQTLPNSGQTLWAGACPEGDAGMSWDWVKLSQGVVAMVDPLSVITNLRFVSPEGEVLSAWQAARHLNDIVHALHWQREVERVLQQRSPQ
jgi:hypothetical protein